MSEYTPIKRPVLEALARGFKERSEALGYKGRARDRAALDYYMGAWVTLDASGDPNANKVGVIGAMLIATRGYAYVLEYVQELDDKAAQEETETVHEAGPASPAQAYQEGISAFYADTPLDANPYGDGAGVEQGECWMAWRRAWENASKGWHAF